MTFPKYELTEDQIRGLANIVQHEQGTEAGQYAESSLMANLTDISGDSKATVSNLIEKATSGWFAYGKTRYKAGYNGTVSVSKTAINAVKNCIVRGRRTLPRYVNEHDCLSDITRVINGSKSNKAGWKSHVTKCRNCYGSNWIFYSFPGGSKTGVDPFGYKSEAFRKKWGEFCYSLEDAKKTEREHYTGTYPELPDKTWGVDRDYYKIGDGYETLTDYPTQIKRVQMILNWYFDKGAIIKVDGKYGEITAKYVRLLQNYTGLPVNGCFGKKCLEVLKNEKR